MEINLLKKTEKKFALFLLHRVSAQMLLHQVVEPVEKSGFLHIMNTGVPGGIAMLFAAKDIIHLSLKPELLAVKPFKILGSFYFGSYF